MVFSSRVPGTINFKSNKLALFGSNLYIFINIMWVILECRNLYLVKIFHINCNIFVHNIVLASVYINALPVCNVTF